MKQFILLVSFLFASAILSAQDTILKTDSSYVLAVIDEINDYSILYHLWDNRTGPTYRIGLDKVARVKFQNGTEQVFREVMTPPDKSAI